ncbi:MAG: PPOX class F420-dependent oxidoreductase [Anaerolineae bacterium]|nr:PPOX class F420-dependent oxidoreductase [Anaerolineae bacterium]
MNHLSQFSNQPFLSLETRRKDGTAVPTPVWFVKDGDALFVRTLDGSGKVKRARNFPEVRVMPCDAQGGSLGTWQDGTSSVDGAEAYGRIKDLLITKYGPDVQQFEERTHAAGGKYTVITIVLA